MQEVRQVLRGALKAVAPVRIRSGLPVNPQAIGPRCRLIDVQRVPPSCSRCGSTVVGTEAPSAAIAPCFAFHRRGSATTWPTGHLHEG